jgi:hypothetical protein
MLRTARSSARFRLATIALPAHAPGPDVFGQKRVLHSFIKRLRMSDSFDERRKNFEEKWAHDEELRFKVLARRDRLLGEWAADELGFSGAERDVYVTSVVQTELTKGGEHAIVRKLHADFDAKKVHHSEHAIHRKMGELLKLAEEQVMKELKK